jgi:uncharacterized protein (DUF2384 family)
MRKSKGSAGRFKAVGMGRVMKKGAGPARTAGAGSNDGDILKVAIKQGKRSYVVEGARAIPATKNVFGSAIITQFIDKEGLVIVDDVVDWFGMSKVQFADTVGVRPETLHRVQRATAPKTQNRVKEMLEIVSRVAEWAGGKDQAMAWYRAEPIPAFGGRTAEALVKEGKATAVRDYLDHVAVGGFV